MDVIEVQSPWLASAGPGHAVSGKSKSGRSIWNESEPSPRVKESIPGGISDDVLAKLSDSR